MEIVFDQAAYIELMQVPKLN